ncbi:hypothetical protein BC940DRAFT_281271 [Gongronella butleri]|nr:hypothetical protein BC940DRAFT_281271 [Gongronella butleri]
MEAEAICRVCRCEGTAHQPLYHPCKCSGSIRYVHQECLTEWLSHSRKKYCELCEHEYMFSPVYRRDMPERIPVQLFVLQFFKKVGQGVLRMLRTLLVACLWLLVLPYFTVTVWRFYFWSGHVLLFRLAKWQQFASSSLLVLQRNYTAIQEPPSFVNHTLMRHHHIHNATKGSLVAVVRLFGYTIRLDDIKVIVSDCFQGQVITCVVVVVFVAIFHLREWIVQNVPEDVLADHDDALLDEEEGAVDDHDALEGDDPVLLHQIEALQGQLREHGFRPARHEIIPWDDTSDDGSWESMDDEDDDEGVDSDAFDRHSDSLPERRVLHGMDDDDQAARYMRATSAPPSTSMFADPPTPQPHRAMSAEPLDHGPRHPFHHRPHHPYYAQAGAASSSSVPGAPRLHHAELQPAMLDDEFTPDTPLPADSPHLHFQHQPLPPDDHERARAAFHHHHHAPPADIGDDTDGEDAPPHPPLNNAREQVDNDVDQDPEDDNDNDIENVANVEDMLDILDAVGLRGGLARLVQNVMLIAFLISVCLGVTVWMPYLIGMTFIMADLIDVVRVPLAVITMVTDPVLDWLINFCTDVVWPQLVISADEVVKTVQDKVPVAWQHACVVLIQHLSAVSNTTSSNATLASPSATPTLLSRVLSAAPSVSLQSAMTSLLHGINQIEPTLVVAFKKYQQVATGTSGWDHLLCIVIGYFVVIFSSYFYVTHPWIRPLLGERIKGTVHQQYLILKVGLFMVLELFMFPVVCGFMLDLCTMSLLVANAAAPYWLQADYLLAHPVSSVFFHWFIGTAFIFMFALMVTSIRGIIRPGVMWFIRDPNDPQFNPIREIIERPVTYQFKKLATSGLMYTIFIVVGIGGLVQAIRFLARDLLPLQWNLTKPLSIMPFDIILIQVALPAVYKYLNPRPLIKTCASQWMRFLCRQLRLSHYMFGERRLDEEGVITYDSPFGFWRSMAASSSSLEQQLQSAWYPAASDDPARPTRTEPIYLSSRHGVFEWDGQFVCAPSHDTVPYRQHRRMLVPVDPDTLQFVHEIDRVRGHPATRRHPDGSIQRNTTIVYLPPHFRARAYGFLLALWLSGSAVLCFSAIAPLALGRYLFKHALGIRQPLHDMYPFLTGAAILLLIGTFVIRVLLAAQDIWHDGPGDRFHRLVQHVRDLSVLVCKWLCVLIAFGFVMPMLLGLIVELYFDLPFRALGDKIPHIDPVALWIRGFACTILVHCTLQIVPANPLQANLHRAFRNGVGHMEMQTLFTKVILPISAVCLTAVVLPLIVALVNVHILAPSDMAVRIRIVQLMYPVSMIGLGGYYIGRAGSRISRQWIDTIREDHYLVGRTLHNIDE